MTDFLDIQEQVRARCREQHISPQNAEMAMEHAEKYLVDHPIQGENHIVYWVTALAAAYNAGCAQGKRQERARSAQRKAREVNTQ